LRKWRSLCSHSVLLQSFWREVKMYRKRNEEHITWDILRKTIQKDIILVAVGYYCRFSSSYRDVSEILKERGVSVHPTTIMRWVHEYAI
jgi:transposase-like protein